MTNTTRTRISRESGGLALILFLSGIYLRVAVPAIAKFHPEGLDAVSLCSFSVIACLIVGLALGVKSGEIFAPTKRALDAQGYAIWAIVGTADLLGTLLSAIAACLTNVSTVVCLNVLELIILALLDRFVLKIAISRKQRACLFLMVLGALSFCARSVAQSMGEAEEVLPNQNHSVGIMIALICKLFEALSIFLEEYIVKTYGMEVRSFLTGSWIVQVAIFFVLAFGGVYVRGGWESQEFPRETISEVLKAEFFAGNPFTYMMKDAFTSPVAILIVGFIAVYVAFNFLIPMVSSRVDSILIGVIRTVRGPVCMIIACLIGTEKFFENDYCGAESFRENLFTACREPVWFAMLGLLLQAPATYVYMTSKMKEKGDDTPSEVDLERIKTIQVEV